MMFDPLVARPAGDGKFVVYLTCHRRRYVILADLELVANAAGSHEGPKRKEARRERDQATARFPPDGGGGSAGPGRMRWRDFRAWSDSAACLGTGQTGSQRRLDTRLRKRRIRISRIEPDHRWRTQRGQPYPRLERELTGRGSRCTARAGPD